jgi:tetratricopeptide (TPR) repeat protein
VHARAALPARAKSATPKSAAAATTASIEAKPVAPAAAVAIAQPSALAPKAPLVAPAPGASAPVAPTAAAPAAVAPARVAPALAPAPVEPVAASATSVPQPSAAPAFVRAPAPAVAEATDSESEEDEGGGGAKLAQARRLLTAEDPEGAEVIARQVLAADPQDHHAMDVLARALMDQERGAEAVPLARRMVQKRGKRVPYRLLLGDLLFMVGNEADARAQWRQALELAPNDLDIKRRLK